ncbi:Het-C-domain-containing protein [Gloeophyllum trabeum ATCC 11539]|uniref:Het-C-domain-containing protein n=1 Tax=Gloeophyllum trabeum (strain ATCC 11539 / FP-39264 / Madison 617) TaxID=670483 RepID=S7QLC9_GLOTA|nr:Het-C-domain-containing protein [Gloeophyllum trabeum ATCC 11539]EPQ60148.1 Het-C-domain-containing protein [Gloeophyllum trabeum ATCC 11539]
MPPSVTTTFLILSVLLLALPSGTYAFGAGDIPDFAYLNDKAFRHGDIENILTELAKTTGQAAAGGGLLSLAQNLLSTAAGGSKFSKNDVKKVYFGNWLRDYSQAMDIGGLSKLSADTLVLIIAVLGFMTFGFATQEFEVTPDRLGVYLPVEHIDNPKGYAEKEGDARQYHPKLRPPVDPRELEIDERTGMKNYMATEDGGWDTSTAHIRRVFRACIENGRRAQGRDGPELYEAYRLLGTGLHTLEDLLAHSNWCELTLRKMGHQEVFCHVGDNVTVNTPNGPAPPLVTGTFGGADFLHSLMGEATDHLSQTSVVDLTSKMSEAQGKQDTIGPLKDLLSKFSLGSDSSDSRASQADDLQAKSKAYEFNPDDIAPPEVQQQLWEVLKWRDDIMREILQKIEMIPGLSELIDGFTDALNAYVYTVLAPWLTPIVQQVTTVLGEGSKAVINSADEYEVFNNPDASDPSHSLLSKDHFQLILNEPAGKVAQVVVQYAVNLIVQAWYNDNEDPDQVISKILEAFHHPYYGNQNSEIQHAMFTAMDKWFGSLGSEEGQQVIQALTKESVKAGRNKRQGSDDGTQTYGVGGDGQVGGYGQQQQGGYGRQQQQSGYGGQQSGYGGQQGGYGGQQGGYGGQQSGRRTPTYGAETAEHTRHSSRRQEEDTYQSSETRTYGSSYSEETPGESYGRRRQDVDSGYEPTYGGGREGEGYGGGRQQEGYGGGRQEGYGASRQQEGYEGEGYAGGRTQESYGGGESYEQPQGHHHKNHHRKEEDSYGGEEYGSSQRTGYQQEESYGGRRDDNEGEYQPSYERSSEGRGGYERQEGYGREAALETESRMYGGREGGYGEQGYGGRPGYGEQEQRGYQGGRVAGEGEYGRGGGESEYGRGGGDRPARGYGGEGYGGDSQETFGAERLRLDEEGEGGYGRRREGSGYGGNEYQSGY